MNATSPVADLLADALAGSFALVRTEGAPTVDVLMGHTVTVASLADIPLRERADGPDVLALVPYRQITERGFRCHDDGSPLLALVVDRHVVAPLEQLIEALPNSGIVLEDPRFEPDDEEYGAMVDTVLRDEIGCGAGANFVIRRDFTADTGPSVTRTALTAFRRLLEQESGAYWTFAVHTPFVSMVGASPERHVSVEGEVVHMNPISGTYRHGSSGANGPDFLHFLDDPKETDELFMVVDEELKMMSDVCPLGGRVLGPYPKQMQHLTHTEYLLRGHTGLDVREVLRRTMFAPTVTGSPIENAARVIERYETSGRGYYSGVLALFGHHEGHRTLDAPILIRTAVIEPSGHLRISAGATLVRESVGAHEVAETHSKIAGILSAVGAGPVRTARTEPTVDLAAYPGVADALARRNEHLARFWIDPVVPMHPTGATVLIVDFEDGWTMMLAHQLRCLGLDVEVKRWSDVTSDDDADILVAGPGPGDPRQITDPRVQRATEIIADRVRCEKPLLAVCLGHQILARVLGHEIVRLDAPRQGVQKTIQLFGTQYRVGFYNTFGALPKIGTGGASIDPETGVLDALTGPGFASIQFHAESILTPDGFDILRELVGRLLEDRSAQHGCLEVTM